MPLMSTHNQIEHQIESFVENFRKNSCGSALMSIDRDSNIVPTTSSYHLHHSVSRSSQLTTPSEESISESFTGQTDSRQFGSSTVDSSSCEGVSVPNYDAMDEAACSLAVRDVAELLQAQHAIITGGKSRDGCPVITFPDTGNFCNINDDDYQKLIIYLTSVPPLQEADLGFVLVIDRRNDKWSSVKGVLLKISGFFPGLIQVAFVLRPNGIFQKAISEVSNKLFKEEFKFKVVVCNCVEELHEHLDHNQLTRDLEGCIQYNHDEWIEQRVAVEKFFANTQEISAALRSFIQGLQESELPNDAPSTEDLLQAQSSEFAGLKDDLSNANRHGDTLLSCLQRPNPAFTTTADCVELYPDSKLINVATVERLLVQLEETERGFDDFWAKHELKLLQCLELRRFELDFRELQSNLELDQRMLLDMTEVGDSVARVEILIRAALDFQHDCKDDLEKALTLVDIGNHLINNQHYALDSIQPKCVELQRMHVDLSEKIQRRIDTLHKYRDLQERIEKANRWCTRGVDLLASQQIEKCSSPEFAEGTLSEVEEFLQSSTEFKLNNPKEFRNIFQDMITPETNGLVQQVLKRIDDVQMMCDKRKVSLKKMAAKPARPVQPVVPEPAVPLTAPRSPQAASVSVHPAHASHSTNLSSVDSATATTNGSSEPPMRKVLKKARTVPKVFRLKH